MGEEAAKIRGAPRMAWPEFAMREEL